MPHREICPLPSARSGGLVKRWWSPDPDLPHHCLLSILYCSPLPSAASSSPMASYLHRRSRPWLMSLDCLMTLHSSGSKVQLRRDAFPAGWPHAPCMNWICSTLKFLRRLTISPGYLPGKIFQCLQRTPQPRPPRDIMIMHLLTRQLVTWKGALVYFMFISTFAMPWLISYVSSLLFFLNSAFPGCRKLRLTFQFNFPVIKIIHMY